MDPHALRATLSCPVCHCPLRAPTTLTCGHTVCAHHPTVPCPLPQCAPPTGPARPRIPPTSRVNYFPPPPPAPLPPAPVDAPKLDVTINKIIALLDSVLADDQPSDDDDDDDYDVPPRSPIVRNRPDSAVAPGRPRKRQRLHDIDDDDDGDLLSHLRASAVRQRDTDPHAPLLPDPRSAQPPNIEKELQTELSCEICFMLLYNPVTTPCQHTFCAKCLHRALDHSNLCPLCRDSLPGFSFFEDHPYNQTLETLLERDARLDTPIFVCMLIFPGHPTALHFFEPRYRLMLRRCLEQDVPSFGMIMPARQGSGAGVAAAQTDYGTMLEVRSVQMLADGRSMVETWSTYRFRILERGTLDGYTVGRIERIDDVPDSPASASPGPPTRTSWSPAPIFSSSSAAAPRPGSSSASTTSTARPPPTPPPLPTGAHLRLRLVVHWIEQLNSNWWFTSGCVIF
ncbi:hypothetical protein B0H13DRAFT_2252636 [Mycena leptocephala]|nr:hypothetical protein B0H13DRAFT_2252636 [Mycena leptocephala]